MIDLKNLIKGKLFPTKASIGTQFEVHRKDVKVQIEVSPLADRSIAFSVHVRDHQPFSMITSTKELLSMGVDTVDCPTFGLSVAACGLSVKMPQCKGCIFNHDN